MSVQPPPYTSTFAFFLGRGAGWPTASTPMMEPPNPLDPTWYDDADFAWEVTGLTVFMKRVTAGTPIFRYKIGVHHTLGIFDALVDHQLWQPAGYKHDVLPAGAAYRLPTLSVLGVIVADEAASTFGADIFGAVVAVRRLPR